MDKPIFFSIAMHNFVNHSQPIHFAIHFAMYFCRSVYPFVGSNCIAFVENSLQTRRGFTLATSLASQNVAPGGAQAQRLVTEETFDPVALDGATGLGGSQGFGAEGGDEFHLSATLLLLLFVRRSLGATGPGSKGSKG